MQKHTLPTYFVSHGGGPWPWMQAENGGMYDKLAASLQDIRARVAGLYSSKFLLYALVIKFKI
jgi:hypothetical protein